NEAAGRLTSVLVSEGSGSINGVRHSFTYDGARVEQIDGFAVDAVTAVETNAFRVVKSHEGWAPVSNAVFFDGTGLGAAPPVWFSRDVSLDHAGRAGELSYAFGWDTQNPFLT